MKGTVEGRAKLRVIRRRHRRSQALRQRGYPVGIGHQIRKFDRLCQKAAYQAYLYACFIVKSMKPSKPKRGRRVFKSEEDRIKAGVDRNRARYLANLQKRRDNPAYRKYMREMMKRRYAIAKSTIDRFKGKGCACGEKRVPCIDIHHIEPGSKRHGRDTISLRGKYWGMERLQKTLEKCIPICSNCHRILHAEERKAGRKVSRTGLG